jgi:hypothetical protein
MQLNESSYVGKVVKLVLSRTSRLFLCIFSINGASEFNY